MIVFVGDESLVVQCASIARSSGRVVGAVASRNRAVRDHAERESFVVIHADELDAFLVENDADLLFSIANERVLPEQVLGRVRLAVNFHDGPLPDYSGLAVTTWALFSGETQHAVTWHTMRAEVDAGDIVEAATFDISPDETAFSLNARCFEAALATFPSVLEKATDASQQFEKQSDRPGSWFGRYQRPIAFFDPQRTAAEIDRAVRSMAFGSRLRNRIGAVRWQLGNEYVIIEETEVLPALSDAPAGTVVAVDPASVRLATSEGDIVVRTATTPTGDTVSSDELRSLIERQPLQSSDDVAQIERKLALHDEQFARDETFWVNRLLGFERTIPGHLVADGAAGRSDITISPADGAGLADLAVVVLTWWARTAGGESAWFEYSDPTIEAGFQSLSPLVHRPLGRFALGEHDFDSARAAVQSELDELSRRGPLLRDVVAREPRLRHRSIDPALRLQIAPANCPPLEGDDNHIDLVIAPDGATLTLRIPNTIAGPDVARRAGEQIDTLLRASRGEPSTPLSQLPLVGDAELELLDRGNDTALDYDKVATVDAQFRAQVDRTPNAPAVSAGATTRTYAELASDVDAFAERLQAAGARRGGLVGLAIERDVDLLVAVLAVLSVGAAYVPIDPHYPADRLAYMVSDSELRVLVAEQELAQRIAGPDVVVVEPRAAATPAALAGHSDHSADDLAYVIYTSGSTGRPKGVMLEHGNVVNFFAAMDEVIEHDEPGTWLAVTSLSFDISVLELLWTVTRGFHVVIQTRSITSGAVPAAARPAAQVAGAPAAQATSLSLFFFAAGDAQASDGYRLLRESAVFADQHGFEAVWLPERHFHEFGGAYPNPSVVAAAIAATTKNIGVRAGSVVLPLHPSARVAEEWAIVDNISGGRVGISFAPGWQPNDFVLNPNGYRTAKDDLQSRIDEVRALWRGEAVDMVGPEDRIVSIRTLPRPVQAELPVWLTSAGSTSTFERAGTMGLNLLTHLLGQSPEQLASNIAVYRNAWTAAGHQGTGQVTVMLHTFLGHDREQTKEAAREPMKRYLASATGLLKNMASAFPTFAKAGVDADEAFKSLTDAEMDELLSVAADRYLETSGLFGTSADATEFALTLSAIGVDEIACLIDFGIDTDAVLGSMPLLAEVKSALEPAVVPEAATLTTVAADEELDESVSALAARHEVSHLQCTPSLAAMLLADPDDRRALGTLQHLMVGGEALPEKLAKELRTVVPARFTNMYGPTETTIWSLVHEIDHDHDGPVPIGRAIANTTLFVLDPASQRVPLNGYGELFIGGDGVARGYLGRDELTRQRFVERASDRIYATGDLARIRPDGIVEFGGRVDFQVKIRGHRIELGEIEARLDTHPSVDRSVVVADGDAASARLIAFVVASGSNGLDERTLRDHVAATLPDVMVPDMVVPIDALPLTPNGKVDRAALPKNVQRGASALAATEVVAPTNDLERLVAETWAEQLGRPVGRTDNFFDIGGHSLLAVAVFRKLQQATSAPIALTDVFRYPTVVAFAAYLQQLSGNVVSTETKRTTGSDRGAMRRRTIERRRGGDPAVEGEAAQ